jgi:hypothetical protein
MMNIIGEYIKIIQDFLSNSISVEEFERQYLTKFKNETREMDDPSFQILDEIFGDVDSLTNDPALLSENQSFYIDEGELRKRLSQAIASLN